MSVVGTSRCDVPARVQRAERMLDGLKTKVCIAPLNAARTAQRAVPTNPALDKFNHTHNQRRASLRSSDLTVAH